MEVSTSVMGIARDDSDLSDGEPNPGLTQADVVVNLEPVGHFFGALCVSQAVRIVDAGDDVELHCMFLLMCL